MDRLTHRCLAILAELGYASEPQVRCIDAKLVDLEERQPEDARDELLRLRVVARAAAVLTEASAAVNAALALALRTPRQQG